PSDASVGVPPEIPQNSLAAIERLPQVRAAAPAVAMSVFPASHPDLYLPMAGSVDGRWSTVIDRPRIIEGRASNSRSTDEVVLTERRAAELELSVGDS